NFSANRFLVQPGLGGLAALDDPIRCEDVDTGELHEEDRRRMEWQTRDQNPRDDRTDHHCPTEPLVGATVILARRDILDQRETVSRAPDADVRDTDKEGYREEAMKGEWAVVGSRGPFHGTEGDPKRHDACEIQCPVLVRGNALVD